MFLIAKYVLQCITDLWITILHCPNKITDKYDVNRGGKYAYLIFFAALSPEDFLSLSGLELELFCFGWDWGYCWATCWATSWGLKRGFLSYKLILICMITNTDFNIMHHTLMYCMYMEKSVTSLTNFYFLNFSWLLFF